MDSFFFFKCVYMNMYIYIYAWHVSLDVWTCMGWDAKTKHSHLSPENLTPDSSMAEVRPHFHAASHAGLRLCGSAQHASLRYEMYENVALQRKGWAICVWKWGILRYIPIKNYDFNSENDNNPLELGDEITYVVSDKSIRVSFFAGLVHLVIY